MGVAFLFLLGWQIRGQVLKGGNDAWQGWSEEAPFYIMGCLLLLAVNIFTEAVKWQGLAALAGKGVPRFKEAFFSVIGGIAAGIVTPNRLGEYPARLLLLGGRRPSLRLVTAAVLGALAQFAALMIWGVGASLYLFQNGGNPWILGCLWGAAGGTLLALLAYFGARVWLPFVLRLKWARRWAVIGRAMRNAHGALLGRTLALSLLRFAVYTTQFWLLLQALNVPVTPLEGWASAALFFWAIAVIPNIAFAELGIRGSVALLLFGHWGVAGGIVLATVLLWLLNLALPAVPGAYLLLRQLKPSPSLPVERQL